MLLNILLGIEKKLLQSRRWIRQRQKAEIERQIKKNDETIDELLEHNIYLRALLGK